MSWKPAWESIQGKLATCAEMFAENGVSKAAFPCEMKIETKILRNREQITMREKLQNSCDLSL